MKFVVRWMLFFLTMTVQIRVRAELLEEPNGCLALEGACAVESSRARRLDFTSPQVWSLSLSPKALVARDQTGAWHLVGGAALLDGQATLSHEFGTVSVDGGTAIVKRQSGRVRVVALLGDTAIILKGSPQEVVKLPAGYQVELSRAGAMGTPQVSVPRAALWSQLVGDLRRFPARGSLLENRALWQRYKSGVVMAAQEASVWHAELASREIAAARERRERAQRHRERILREQEAMRALLKEKNQLD